jgi:crotonobetainyl-CoA:carnitine CoA-transferase CaiB-like acyl-CoA transferase
MPRALDGIRVLELAGGAAGEYLGQLLADQGADVLMIEPPGGGPLRGRPQFHVWNRGKRSAVCDLESDDGHAMLADLASRADVLITDLSPGEAATRGLDHATLSRRNPGLVHAWLPPYGEAGPDADRPPDEALAAALGGVFAGQPSENGEPVFVTLPLAAYGCALLAASAVTAALLARERDGVGQRVSVSWLAGAMAVQTGSLVRAPQFSSPLAMTGLSRRPQGAIPVYGLHRAKDGWLFIACGNSVFFNKLCIALGRPDLAADERFAGAPWGLINREHQDALRTILAPIIASKPREHWLRLFEKHDVPSAPVLSRSEYMDDPQVVHNGLRLEMDDPELGRVVMAGPPLTFSATPPIAPRPAPRLGEHTAGALNSWPVRAAGPAARRRRSARPPLAGVRVLDLTSYIAGSLCPMTLADYGADVIKVESLEGDAFRTFGLGFLGWNKGKRGIAIDLKTAEGREVLHRLARDADVVVENFRTGVAARLGADYETLSALNRRLVYCTMAGWGETGPRAELPAFDPLLQARSGAMRAQGGADDPIFLAVAITDYAAAHLGAYGVMAALYVRERIGRGQRVVLSLTGATMAIQSGEFIFPAAGGSFRHEVIGGKDFPGPSAAYRSYRCADGWLFLACTAEAHWRATAKAIGRPELAYPNSWPAAAQTEPRGGIAGVIQETLAEDTVERWMGRLASHGVPCAPVVALQQVLEHPQVTANGLVAEFEHPAWGLIRQTGALARFSRTPGGAVLVAPTLGQHTKEVLREARYDDAQIAVLKGQRIVTQA